MSRSLYIDGPHLLRWKVVDVRGARVKDIAATENSGIYIFCGPDISRDDFYVLGEERPLLYGADEHSHVVPTIAELIDEVSAEESGRSRH
jgi:hypothetical protein